MIKGIVLSLYDFTGEALKPWAEAGYQCYAFDIQHPEIGKRDTLEGGGYIEYIQLDLWQWYNIKALHNLSLIHI